MKHEWWNDYVGIPYELKGRTTAGIDCWGLVRLVYREQFNIELPSFTEEYFSEYDDKTNAEIIAAKKESWTQLQDPKPGSVVLLNILGYPSHVGVVIDQNTFLHARLDDSVGIEKLSDPRWKRRIVGFYQYQEASAVNVSAAPNPLKTTRVDLVVSSGMTAQQVVQGIAAKFALPKDLQLDYIVYVDGVPVAPQDWATTTLAPGQLLEYRVIPGRGQGGRLFAMLAISVFAALAAPYIVGSSMGLTGATWGAATSASIAGTSLASTVALQSAIVGMGINVAGALLLDAIFPIREPKSEILSFNDSSKYITGGANQVNKYGAIPVVLGRVRYSPPVAAQPYIDSSSTSSILRTILCWGYGPLQVDNLTINNRRLETFENSSYAITHSAEQDPNSAFNKLYGVDTVQQNVNTELASDSQLVSQAVFRQGTNATTGLPEHYVKIRVDGQGKNKQHDLSVGQIVRLTFTDISPGLQSAIPTSLGSSTSFKLFGMVGNVDPYARYGNYSEFFGQHGYYFNTGFNTTTYPDLTNVIAFGTGTFTIEGYFSSKSTRSAQAIFGLDVSATEKYTLRLVPGADGIDRVAYTRTLNGTKTDIMLGTTPVKNNLWNHIAISRDSSNNLRLYLNGVQEAFLSNHTVNYTERTPIVAIDFDETGKWVGSLSNVRVNKGLAKYTTGSFVVEQLPFLYDNPLENNITEFPNVGPIDTQNTLRRAGETLLELVFFWSPTKPRSVGYGGLFNPDNEYLQFTSDITASTTKTVAKKFKNTTNPATYINLIVESIFDDTTFELRLFQASAVGDTEYYGTNAAFAQAGNFVYNPNGAVLNYDLLTYGEGVETSVPVTFDNRAWYFGANEWITNTINTQQVDRIGVTLTLPQGLYSNNASNGNTESAEVSVEVQIRAVGETTWNEVSENFAQKEFNIDQSFYNTDNDAELERTYRWNYIVVDSQGSLQVRLGSKSDSSTLNPQGLMLLRLQQEQFGFTDTVYNVIPVLQTGDELLWKVLVYGDTIVELYDERANASVTTPSADFYYKPPSIGSYQKITSVSSPLTVPISGAQIRILGGSVPRVKALLTDGVGEAGTWTKNGIVMHSFTKTISFDVARNYYDVRVRRVNSNKSSVKQYSDKVYLSYVTGYTNNTVTYIPPKDSYGNSITITRMSAQLQSTGQLNGQVEGITGTAQTLGWDYSDTTISNISRTSNIITIVVTGDPKLTAASEIQIEGSSSTLNGIYIVSTASTVSGITTITCASTGSNASSAIGRLWVRRAIRNPAALYRFVLESQANPKANIVQIDYAAVADWYSYCAGKGFLFDAIIANARPLLEVLKDVCAAGRASPTLYDGRWGVVVDREKSTIVQHFTPHNSWDFEGVRGYPQLPHAFRVNFINSEKGYQEDEMFVYNDGYTSSNATLFETLELPGITTKANIFKHARYHLAQLKLRPEKYNLNVDLEHLICTRGDRVKVTHFVPQFGLYSGRVDNIIPAEVVSGNVVQGTKLVISELVDLKANTFYSIRIRTKYGESLLYSIKNLATEGSYTTLEICSQSNNTTPVNIDTAVSVDDLIMLGTANAESVDMLVLSVEPIDNLGAKLTLVDYSPSIFTSDSEVIPEFNSNVSLPPQLQAKVITAVPVPLTANIISDHTVMQKLGSASFLYRISVPIDRISSATRLQQNITHIEAQKRLVTDTEWSDTLDRYPIDNAGVLVTGVMQDQTYNLRFRYISSDGISGNWSAPIQHTVVGKRSPPSGITGLSTNAIAGAKLKVDWTDVPDVDFFYYEVRYSNAAWGTADYGRWTTATSEYLDDVPASIDTSKTVNTVSYTLSDNSIVLSSVSGLVVGNYFGVYGSDTSVFGNLTSKYPYIVRKIDTLNKKVWVSNNETTSLANQLVADRWYIIVAQNSTNFTLLGSAANTAGTIFKAIGNDTNSGTGYTYGTVYELVTAGTADFNLVLPAYYGYRKIATKCTDIQTTGLITCVTTSGMYVGMPLVFSGNGNFPGIQENVTYYVHSIVNSNNFFITATPGGSIITSAGSPNGELKVTGKGDMTVYYVRTRDYDGNYSTDIARTMFVLAPVATMGTAAVSVSANSNQLKLAITQTLPTKPTDFAYYDYQISRVYSGELVSYTDFWSASPASYVKRIQTPDIITSISLLEFVNPLGTKLDARTLTTQTGVSVQARLRFDPQSLVTITSVENNAMQLSSVADFGKVNAGDVIQLQGAGTILGLTGSGASYSNDTGVYFVLRKYTSVVAGTVKYWIELAQSSQTTQYVVAVRMVDISGNYSSASALGTCLYFNI